MERIRNLTYASKFFTKWELVLWDPVIESREFGSKQWWFARQQGRFYNMKIHAN